MGEVANRINFEYASIRAARAECAGEQREALREEALQSLWYTQQGLPKHLHTDQGQRLKIISPGWWNRGEGPDFLGAHIEFNGRLKTGDIEIHLRHQDWNLHGHHKDPRYNDVLLHVVLDGAPRDPARTATGRPVPALIIANFLKQGIEHVTHDAIEPARGSLPPHGRCASWSAQRGGADALKQILELAGEWRLMFKARAMMEHMDRANPGQAVYERLVEACGYTQYKNEFLALARHLPYERARQLAREDAQLLEAAYLQIAGLLPDSLPGDAPGNRHWQRLQQCKQERLSGLRTVALRWNRAGVRPTNFPERRLAGLARLLARTATTGLTAALEDIWLQDARPIERRARFEMLFPRAMGFWANHCTWTGKPLRTPNAPIGAARVRSIIGNVFVPAGLAAARLNKDWQREALILAFYARLPQEQHNHITRIMLPRLFGNSKPPRMTFRIQQGLLQMFLDWCEPNPACQNCAVLRRLNQLPPPNEDK